ncbi:MAG: phosphatidylglycerophosphatase A family protein [Terriglobales bacterium]
MTTETEPSGDAEAAGAARTPWAWWVATFFGAGHLHPGPGTHASLITAVFWWVLAMQLAPSWHLPVLAALALIATLTGIPAAGIVARESGRKDPPQVVIDEVAGQMIAMLSVPYFLPLTWKYLLASLILFRAFDIVKPPPVRQLERLPGGWGIMLDDVAAGLLALLSLQLLMHFRVLD